MLPIMIRSSSSSPLTKHVLPSVKLGRACLTWEELQILSKEDDTDTLELGSEMGLVLIDFVSCMKLYPDWNRAMWLDVTNASVGVVEVRVDCKSVFAWEWHKLPVTTVELESGMDMTEAVRVTVDAKSASLNVFCPTGVKALVSLFCSCCREEKGKVGLLAAIEAWSSSTPCCAEREVVGGSVCQIREGRDESAAEVDEAVAAVPEVCIILWSGELLWLWSWWKWWGWGEGEWVGDRFRASENTRFRTLPESMRSGWRGGEGGGRGGGREGDLNKNKMREKWIHKIHNTTTRSSTNQRWPTQCHNQNLNQPTVTHTMSQPEPQPTNGDPHNVTTRTSTNQRWPTQCHNQNLNQPTLTHTMPQPELQPTNADPHDVITRTSTNQRWPTQCHNQSLNQPTLTHTMS